MKPIYYIAIILLLLTPASVHFGYSEEVKDLVKKESPDKKEKLNKKNIKEPITKELIDTNSKKVNPQTNTNIQTVKHVQDLSDEDTEWSNADIFMVLFTAILALFTIGLWREANRSVKITENTAKRQLRAYIFARLADGEKLFPDEINCLSVPIIIENHGQTPGHQLKISTFVNIYKNPLNETLDPPNFQNGSQTYLAPGQIIRMYPTLPRSLKEVEVNAITSKEGSFYVWGYLEYIDIFDNKQKTEFRLYSTGADFTRGELAYSLEGNTAT
ncbi:MAG: hypothetical protein VR65_17990 [Desulfobulbaceae bacterium BRH_c16a]|nr:MAG: hypothetical protein VR65_17990 [Desulfobulbaceae bacterium BRH_c16a]